MSAAARAGQLVTLAIVLAGLLLGVALFFDWLVGRIQARLVGRGRVTTKALLHEDMPPITGDDERYIA